MFHSRDLNSGHPDIRSFKAILHENKPFFFSRKVLFSISLTIFYQINRLPKRSFPTIIVSYELPNTSVLWLWPFLLYCECYLIETNTHCLLQYKILLFSYGVKVCGLTGYPLAQSCAVPLYFRLGLIQ